MSEPSSAPPSVPPVFEPTLKDHCFEPEHPIGSGSFGVVYRAVYKDGQDRALKFFQGGQVDLAKVRRELQRLRTVAQHPGIVDVLDFDLACATPYFAMKLHADRIDDPVRGTTWRGRTLPPRADRWTVRRHSVFWTISWVS